MGHPKPGQVGVAQERKLPMKTHTQNADNYATHQPLTQRNGGTGVPAKRLSLQRPAPPITRKAGDYLRNPTTLTSQQIQQLPDGSAQFPNACLQTRNRALFHPEVSRQLNLRHPEGLPQSAHVFACQTLTHSANDVYDFWSCQQKYIPKTYSLANTAGIVCLVRRGLPRIEEA